MAEYTVTRATQDGPGVNNRRTMCGHCSLRTDLPGFISREHAEGNAAAIETGQLFECHMISDPTHDGHTRICLGAALVAKTRLGNPPARDLPGTYDDLGTYIDAQEAGRRSNFWLDDHADKWYDDRGKLWYGWWSKATAGNWRYLMTTLDDNANGSVYLFFDQAEQLFGPLQICGGMTSE